MRRRFLRPALVFALLLVTLAGAAAAQFGQNRIQYRDFDWKIYRSPHFNVYYSDADDVRLQRTVSLAESAYDELSRAFDYQIQEPTPLIIYATHSAFLQNNIIINGIPQGAQAFATPVRFRIVLPVDLPEPDLYALIKHELTHIFQYHILFRGKLGGSLRGRPPLWFMEGMASFMADDETLADKKYIRDAVVNDRIPSIRMQGGGFFAYRYGHAVFEFMEERWGKDSINDLIYEMRNTVGSDIGRAIQRVFRLGVEDFDFEFRRWLRTRYLNELVRTGEPGDFGRPFRLDPGSGGGFETSAAASPSGDLVAALTTDKAEIDVSLFDAQNRRRLRVLTRGLDRQVRSIVSQYGTVARRAGSDLGFSPDGNYLAAFAQRESGYSLILIDVLEGGLHQIIDMEVEQQLAPSFSPDGRTIAFAGNLDGRSDIFQIDLETLNVTNVTRDEPFDAAPAFSPDGRWLAYTTWSGDTSQIVRIDLSDPSKRYAITNDEFNNKEPVYSADGQRVYFTSDRSGVDNIYGIDLDTGAMAQYTNAVTACDQPTVLPLPDGGERLVYTGYWKSRFDLYMRDVDEPVATFDPINVPESPLSPGDLPEFQPDIEITLDERNIDPYKRSRFFLEDAVTFFGVDTDQVVTGRVILQFSDYLGDRRIIADLAAVDSLSDFDVVYFNQKNRWQWYGRAFDDRAYARFLNESGRIERDNIFRRTGLEAGIVYPFNVQNRIEASLGYIFREYEGFAFADDITGTIIPVISPRDDDYPEIRASFVHDSSIFASYGAVAGRRIRVSSSWAPDTAESGTLTATTFIDARQYIPITRRSNFAFRAFGLTSEGDFPDVTFIGGLDTLRGFRVREFGGFRAFYANAEFRFPLIDVLATPILQFQSVRGVVFFDVGAAWFPDISDFDFYNSDEDRLEDGVAAYGFGFTIRFLGLDLNWDFAKLYDFQDSADGFETSFWIGRRF